MIDKIEEGNSAVSLQGKCVDILEVIRVAMADFWKSWISDHSDLDAKLGQADKDVSVANEADVDPPAINLKLILQHSRRLNGMDFFSSLDPDSETAIDEQENAQEMDLSYEKNDRLARRLFFDLRQDGSAGTMFYLEASCTKLIFGAAKQSN